MNHNETIREFDGNFILSTEHTSYCFSVNETGQLEHLYYGKKIKVECASDFEVMKEKHEFAPGNSIAYDQAHQNYALEDVCLEMSGYGKGDIRDPMITLIHADGNTTTDFVYDGYDLCVGKEPLKTMPSSYDENDHVAHLIIYMKEAAYNLTLEMHYCVFYDTDVITRYVKLINESEETITLTRCLSMLTDHPAKEYVFTTFNGSWIREMQRHDVNVTSGKYVNSTMAGTSSSRANPFVMLSDVNTTETSGSCYGYNLIYSGNHYESVEVNTFGKTRITTGVNPEDFAFLLEKGECFETPEAIMTYSYEGYNGMSQHMHAFVRNHIIRGEWKNKTRPVLLNSWEATYFDINEEKLLSLAKAGKDVGIELFVMDDGWFGKRDIDTMSLGDWYVNKDKLPNGIKGLCDKVNALGMDFGIWVEPEMVNVDSDLYRTHPEWTMQVRDLPHAEGRSQRILDLANPAVVDFIIESMSEIFSSANISYVKWDMNRIFSDCYSPYLDEKHQQETSHRYVMGLYRCMDELTRRFPHILFEGCSSGGNRFDLGILSYFPQIWGSDNTDAISRIDIQNGYSYGYPLSTVGAHVSACPNHQTMRATPLKTRFHVASFGLCGYEYNLCELSKEELEEIEKQIVLYKEWREVLQKGQFYRVAHGNITQWICVSEDRKKAVGMIVQKLMRPNEQYHCYRALGLDPERKYHFSNVSNGIRMDRELTDCHAYGDILMYQGVKLNQAFGGTGSNDNVRDFADYASRMYFIESEE